MLINSGVEGRLLLHSQIQLIKMAFQHILYFLVLLFLSSSSQMALVLGSSRPSSSKLYIVYLGEKQQEDPELVTASHHHMLSFLLGSKEEAMKSIVYSYRHGFSGFAAMLTPSQSHQLAELPEVMSIKPSGSVRLHTTRSWDYLGLGYSQQHQPQGLLQRANFGDGIIIGVVDSGIWPESRSFNDDGYGPIPSRWKGTCEAGQNFTANNCNRKLIGARWYTGGVEASQIRVDYKSPRDFNGHGTHTASTAAGSFVANASYHGLGAGTARGGAPRARLAIYKACWGTGRCGEATVLKAIDDAVHDGVDILSLSLGGMLSEYYASIHAVAMGITVVFAGMNDGALPQTISNSVPWVITVAASTIDRSFPTVITLGDNTTVVGQSIFYESKDEGFKELVYGGTCFADDLNSTNVWGKIVFCGYPISGYIIGSYTPAWHFSVALQNVKQVGGSGIIFAQHPASNLHSFIDICNGTIICVFVDYDIGKQIGNYWSSTTTGSPMVKVNPTRNVVGSGVWSPTVAAFSSRGPSILFPDLVKPDITAPGVTILAAMGDSYKFESGTSMACPHVSGVAALLKAVHPHWSPAAIKSALVTTAQTTTAYGFPIQAEGVPRKIADPFDFGGGHIDPNRAADPGLIYDVHPKDYFKYFHCTKGASNSACSQADNKRLYHLNLPSVAIPDLKTSVTVRRTVTNVGDANSIYKAVAESPPGVKMTVEPSLLEFNPSKTASTFALTFTALERVQGGYSFGSLTWRDGGKHSVRIPIAVRVIIQDSFSDTS